MKDNSAPLKYSLIRSSRKSIGIIVHPDGRVVVRAPMRASSSQIQQVLDRRMDWIIKHKNRYAEQMRLNPKRAFVSGEKHLFLGEEYVLRVKNGIANRVTKNCEYIDIECADANMAELLMQQWYKSKAKEVFPNIVNPVIRRFRSVYNVAPAKITVKSMKSRWGSCSSRGSVSLNSKLVQAPPRCIEYVIVHELCHLIHFNHSKDFYTLLAEIIPDWKERKKELKRILPYGC
jgi:hypothetical protein